MLGSGPDEAVEMERSVGRVEVGWGRQEEAGTGPWRPLRLLA